MAKFLDKLMGKPGEEDYVEIDLAQFEEVSAGPQETFIRVAELNAIEILPDIKKEIYDGNIILLDISLMKRDRTLLDRAIGELRNAVEDVQGDIAGVGDDLVVITPASIKIDREKVVGGKD
jgi:SepF-like predicted cell division protein (DUF552 family)